MLDTERNQPYGYGFRLRIFKPGIRNRERRIYEPHAEFERQLILYAWRENRANGGRNAAMQPRYGFAACIEPGLQPFHGNGVIIPVLNVILTRPGQLYGCAVHGLTEKASLDKKIGL